MKKIFLILIVVVSLFSCNEHKVTSVEMLGNASRVMNIGQRDTLEVIIHPIESHIYNTIFWKSSNPNVASVDANGVVTAVYSGTCTITATAGDKRASCEIKVNAIDLEFDFAKAVLYFFGNGNYGDENVNTSLLRFYSAGYNIEPDGSVSGAGYYLNVEINYPAPNILPPSHIYTNAENHDNFTFLSGKLDNEGNALGTYIVFSGLDGTGGIMLESGSLNITDNAILGNFLGASGEKIEIKYYNGIHIVDLTLPPPDTLKINNYYGLNYSVAGNSGGVSFRKYEIYLNGFANYLQIVFVVPVSAYKIPVGFYRLNNTNQPYSLAASDLENGNGTILVENYAPSKAILYGNVKVEAAENGACKYTIYLVDDTGRVIVGQFVN